MQYKEIEYKFWAGDLTKEDFQKRIEVALDEKLTPIYVVSCDDYYIRDGMEEGSFLRYRKGDGKKELTLKTKENGNAIRKEINLDVNDNNDALIVQFIDLSGYTKVHSIFKQAWIYNLEEERVDISYYTLPDGRSVIEVESTNYDSVEEGLALVETWSKKLELFELKKERRSLFEIHNDELKVNSVQLELFTN